MAFALEPNPELLTPNYWGGVDINNPNHFSPVPYPAMYATRSEDREARAALFNCLEHVMQGDATEVIVAKSREFEPSQAQHPDGTVMIIDHEHLSKKVGLKDRGPATDPNLIGQGTPPISSPFAEHWKAQQTREAGNPYYCKFGDEDAYFGEENAYYGRFLTWGVLLSRESKGSEAVSRYVNEWSFAMPTIAYDEVRMPRGGAWLTPLPLEVGVAQPAPEAIFPAYALRMISRVREVRVVYPASGRREQSPALHERLREQVRETLGKISLPSPRPLPIPGHA